MPIDQTARLAVEGYAWLPNLRRRAGTDAVGTRLSGRPVVGLCGPEAARFFYDERHLRRHGALPEMVRGTLFGEGAVHTLDGGAHLRRKAMFTALMTPPRWTGWPAGWPTRGTPPWPAGRGGPRSPSSTRRSRRSVRGSAGGPAYR
ncbi:hypothetical protein [Plantactinospora sp. KBS50]|uniref:hypothetical protein n=1 Tax=Plantactinospora sp. KBS50 TaxID=2024580 RepID=UPI001E2C992C|nr:hypothetical protein [Plantactinospora sp. KBS50]